MPQERKVVLLGPPAAGKTSFFNRCTKKVSHTVNGRTVEFDLVDTVGNSIFGESGTGGNVFVGVRIVLCLFNLNSKKSWEGLIASDRFDNLEHEIARRRGIISRIDFIMIGSHCDKGDDKVEQEEINEFIETINFFRLDRKYFRCSSLTGEGINEIMDFVAKTIVSDESKREGLVKVNKTTENANPQSGDCCVIM